MSMAGNCNKKVTIGENNFTYCYDEVGNLIGIFDEDQINIITEQTINNYGGDTYIINNNGDTLTSTEIVQVIKEYIYNGSNGTDSDGVPTYTTIINGQEVTIRLDRFGAEYYNAANIRPIAKCSLVNDTDYVYPNTSVNNLPLRGWYVIPTSSYKDNNGKNRTDWLKEAELDTPMGKAKGVLIEKTGWYHVSFKAEILLTGAIDAIRVILFYNKPKNAQYDLPSIILDKKYGQADQMSLDTVGTDHPLDRGVYFPFAMSGEFLLEKGAEIWLGGRVSPYVDKANDDLDDYANHTHSASATKGSVTVHEFTDPDGEMRVPTEGKFRVRATGLISGVGDGTGAGSQIPHPEAATGFTVKRSTDINGQSSYSNVKSKF